MRRQRRWKTTVPGKWRRLVLRALTPSHPNFFIIIELFPLHTMALIDRAQWLITHVRKRLCTVKSLTNTENWPAFGGLTARSSSPHAQGTRQLLAEWRIENVRVHKNREKQRQQGNGPPSRLAGGLSTPPLRLKFVVTRAKHFLSALLYFSTVSNLNTTTRVFDSYERNL